MAFHTTKYMCIYKTLARLIAQTQRGLYNSTEKATPEVVMKTYYYSNRNIPDKQNKNNILFCILVSLDDSA